MADQIYVKPGTVNGVLSSVRHPSRAFQPVPADGCFLPNDSFTRKRMREGGLVATEAPVREPEAAPTEAPAAQRPRRVRDGENPHASSE